MKHKSGKAMEETNTYCQGRGQSEKLMPWMMLWKRQSGRGRVKGDGSQGVAGRGWAGGAQRLPQGKQKYPEWYQGWLQALPFIKPSPQNAHTKVNHNRLNEYDVSKQIQIKCNKSTTLVGKLVVREAFACLLSRVQLSATTWTIYTRSSSVQKSFQARTLECPRPEDLPNRTEPASPHVPCSGRQVLPLCVRGKGICRKSLYLLLSFALNQKLQ